MDSYIRNTFAVLTHRCEIEDILEMYEGKDAMFFGNPVDIRDEEIEDMIKYFEETEEYEYCRELKELLEAKELAEFDMFMEKLRNKNGETKY
tara:strand:- start:280 stop:555 length:276 start_codon:yes stop_codon:yes gene_type:complete